MLSTHGDHSLSEVRWRKSSRSGGGNQCVEVALACAEWRKSSHSQANLGSCVEVARNLPEIIAVRDSKNPSGPALVFSPQAWREFTASLKG